MLSPFVILHWSARPGRGLRIQARPAPDMPVSLAWGRETNRAAAEVGADGWAVVHADSWPAAIATYKLEYAQFI